jgi:hypothetical protein
MIKSTSEMRNLRNRLQKYQEKAEMMISDNLSGDAASLEGGEPLQDSLKNAL